MAHGVHGVSAWCSGSVHVVHVVADSTKNTATAWYHSTTVPVQDGTGMEICNANFTCANRWIVPLRLKKR